MHDALLKRMERFGLASAFTATQILEAANRILPEGSKAKTFHDGVLTVEVGSGPEGYFLKQEQETYCERINAALSEQKVRQIRFRLKHES